MSFPNDPKVIYIILSIKLDIGNDMDQGHFVCDVLDYNTGTWWNCDDEKVTQYLNISLKLLRTGFHILHQIWNSYRI